MSAPVGHADDKPSGFEIVFLCIGIKSGLYISGLPCSGLAPIQCTPRLTSRAYTGALALKLDLGFYALSLLLAIKISPRHPLHTPASSSLLSFFPPFPF